MDYLEYISSMEASQNLLDEISQAWSKNENFPHRLELLQKQKNVVLQNIKALKKKAIEDKVFHAKFGELFEELKKSWKDASKEDCTFTLMPFKDKTQPKKPWYYLEFEVNRPKCGFLTFSTLVELSETENLTDANLKNADLSNGNLTNANMTNANLENANLTDGGLANVYLANVEVYPRYLQNDIFETAFQNIAKARFEKENVSQNTTSSQEQKFEK